MAITTFVEPLGVPKRSGDETVKELAMEPLAAPTTVVMPMTMPETVPQSYANHKQYVFSHHVATFVPLVLCLIWSVTRLVQHPSADTAFMVVLVLVVGSVWYHGRVFAIKAQSRLIRLAEMA